MTPDLEFSATFTIGGKLIAAYNEGGDLLYLAPEWEMQDGHPVQVRPMRTAELYPAFS